jgi:hypothetical protein
MKVGGVEVTKCEEVLVLPRKNEEDNLVFRAVAVPNMEEFDSIVPKPTPPKKLVAGGKREDHITDAFVKELEQYGQMRYAYICLKSLEPSEIEWDTVDMKKPSTWTNWMEELRGAGLSDVELNRVQTLVLEANALNEAKLKAARESFLRGQVEDKAESSGRQTTLESSQSGQPAND